jgi:TetR/AcrR family transcriptional regulator, mexJK operon transcriptional repressor
MDDASPSPPEFSPKRQQIARAAEVLFFAHGYGAVSMDWVAREAGVSKATLYAHFLSKDGLFASIVTDRGEDSPIVDALFPDDVPDLRAALLEIGRRVLRFLMRPRTQSLLRVAIAESTRFPELGRAVYTNGPQKFCDRFVLWLDRLTATGRVSVPDTLGATLGFMALLRSDLFLRAALGVSALPGDEEIEATVTAAVDIWLRAFAPLA